ncbi:hypothetical protein [Nisaea sp.]|uniref:hypothetical protein n=1 Tax=Nisaea sp. TaxID=2024842 RepID=UPI003B52488F
MKRYAHYFLQSRPATARGGHWETLEQARAYSVLKSGLLREIANDRGAEVRLVGAYHDDATGEWQYAQLFYLDQTAVDLPGAADDEYDEDERDEGGAGFDDDAVDGFGTASAEEDEIQESRYETEAEPAETDTETRDGLPWASRDGADAAPEAYDELPPVFHKPMPKRRSPVKALVLMLLVLLLIGGIAASVLLYLQHPAILSLADRAGLGEYARMFPHASAARDTGMSTPQDEPVVMPLTTGNVVTYRGIAPTLVGRWSPDNCAENYVVFTDNGYTVTRDGQTSAETVEITETLEDDFQYYLRRTPTLVEHLQKLGPNDIQMAGSTGTGGFMPSGNSIQILNRCPRQ